MEKRTANINFSPAGGTAAKGAQTCKVTLPTAWVKEMGFDPHCRTAELSFDGQSITLTRRLPLREFETQKLAQGHQLCRLRFYDGHELCTILIADYTDQSLAAEDHVKDPVKTAFGNRPCPDWNDFLSFLARRCVPKERAGLREYLNSLGLDAYDPAALVRKTGGRMAEDDQWIEWEDLT